MSGLTRKKITVKRKGKTFQRSVMVKSDQGRPGALHMIRNHGAQIMGRGALIGTASWGGQIAAKHALNTRLGSKIKNPLVAVGLVAGSGAIAGAQAQVLLYRPNSVRAQRIMSDYSRSSWGGKVAFQVMHYGAGIAANHAVNKGVHTLGKMYSTRRREAEARRQSR